MHVRYITPCLISRSTLGAAVLERRHRALADWAAPDTHVSITEIPSGPASIESAYEEYLCVPALAEALLTAEREQVDAVIVGCFDDPGVEALREIATRTAVIGPGVAALHCSALLGTSIGIVAVPEPGALRRLIAAHGMSGHVSGIEVLQSSVLGLHDDAAQTGAAIKSAASRLIRGGADVIALGCMAMSFLGLDDYLQAELGVPVINPARSAVATAELIVRCGLLPSKRAYPLPPKMAAGASLADLTV